MNTHIKKGDKVMVIAGKEKGKTGEVLMVNPEAHRVIVEGINIVLRAKKARSAQDTGGITKKEAAIDSSNVMPICSKCDKPVRVKHVVATDANGKSKSARVCAKCGAVLEFKSEAKKVAKKAKKSEKEEKAAETKEQKKVEKTEKVTDKE